MKPVVLSTKKLKPNQKELLLNSGIGLVERDFISIEPLEVNIDPDNVFENIIFTSKNSVKIVLTKLQSDFLKTKNIFCVGEETAKLLQKNDLNVVEAADYGSVLAEKIAAEYKDEAFTFFCGKKRNNDLPDFLKQKNINLNEIFVYDTFSKSEKIERVFDGILFFSPSAVKSFCEENKLNDSVAFCIGTTTASEAKKHTEKIMLANKPSIENVLVQAVKYFKNKKND